MVDEAIELATALAKLLTKLLDGSATPEEHRRVRDVLHEESASEKALRDIETLRRLARIADLDNPEDG